MHNLYFLLYGHVLTQHFIPNMQIWTKKKHRKKNTGMQCCNISVLNFLSFLKCCSSTAMNTTVKIYSHYISLRINFTCMQVNPPLKESTLRCFIHNISPLKTSVFFNTLKTVIISTEPWTAFERTLTDLDVIMASTILTVQCKVKGIQQATNKISCVSCFKKVIPSTDNNIIIYWLLRHKFYVYIQKITIN